MKKINNDIEPNQKFSFMKELKLHQIIVSGCAFLIIGILLISPLFHLHEEEDHQYLCGKTFHSHSMPLNVSESEDNESEVPHDEDEQLLQIIPMPIRIQVVDSEYLSHQIFFLIDQNAKTLLQYVNSQTNFNHQKISNISPQWEKYRIFVTSLSPPFV